MTATAAAATAPKPAPTLLAAPVAKGAELVVGLGPVVPDGAVPVGPTGAGVPETLKDRLEPGAIGVPVAIGATELLETMGALDDRLDLLHGE